MGLQLSRLERTPDKREVGGSSPLEPTKGFELDENQGKDLKEKHGARSAGKDVVLTVFFQRVKGFAFYSWYLEN